MRKYILISIMTLFISSCSNLGKYEYQPIEDVKLKVILNEISYNSDNGNASSILYFDYKIINESTKSIYFNFDSVKVNFNGSISSRIYFNSIASVIPTRKHLQNGENEFPLYAVFLDSIVSFKNNSLKIVSYGFVN